MEVAHGLDAMMPERENRTPKGAGGSD
jgi:hypothetical protein